MWRVVIPRRVLKELERLDRRQQRRMLAALALIQDNPYRGKKLGGHPHRYSSRVWPYCIIYELGKKQKVIVVVR